MFPTFFSNYSSFQQNDVSQWSLKDLMFAESPQEKSGRVESGDLVGR